MTQISVVSIRDQIHWEELLAWVVLRSELQVPSSLLRVLPLHELDPLDQAELHWVLPHLVQQLALLLVHLLPLELWECPRHWVVVPPLS